MKKNATSITVLIMIVFLMIGFTACEKLKINNLRANHYLRMGNGFYQEERFRRAVEAYEQALEYNPELKQIYFHLATSYASLYKPMKETEANKLLGDNALKYLKLAREQQPDNIQIVHVLGDLYEKMNKIDEAEECYLTIMDSTEDNAKAYYVLAQFYVTHGQLKKAEDMYKKRIEMDPENPEGYHYIAGYYQDRNDWYRAVEYNELRISALIDPSIVLAHREILQYNDDLDKIESKKKYIANVRRNKAIPLDQRNELIAKMNKELEEIGTEAEIAKKIEEKKKEVEELKKQAEEKIKGFDEKKKHEIADAYYMLGLVIWNQSHQTSPEYMGPEERMQIIAKGLKVLDKSLELKKNNWEVYSIIGLLHRQKIKANPLKEAEYLAAWKVAYDKAMKLRDRALKRARVQQELEEMGEEAANNNEGGN